MQSVHALKDGSRLVITDVDADGEEVFELERMTGDDRRDVTVITLGVDVVEAIDAHRTSIIDRAIAEYRATREKYAAEEGERRAATARRAAGVMKMVMSIDAKPEEMHHVSNERAQYFDESSGLLFEIYAPRSSGRSNGISIRRNYDGHLTKPDGHKPEGPGSVMDVHSVVKLGEVLELWGREYFIWTRAQIDALFAS